MIKYATRQSQNSIKRLLDYGNSAVDRILKALVGKIPSKMFLKHELGGSSKIVQVDETMLNHKCNSHRRRSAENKTDALYIFQTVDGIVRVFYSNY